MKLLDKTFRQNQKTNDKVKNMYNTYDKGLFFGGGKNFYISVRNE